MDIQLDASFAHPWKVISIIDIAFFSIFLVTAAYPLFHITKVAFFRYTRVILLYTLLLLTKITSGGISVYLLNNVSLLDENKGINLYIAAAVLMSLAPGLLMMITFKIVQYINSTYRVGKQATAKLTIIGLIRQIQTPGERLEAIQMLYWYLVILTLALSSAGNGMISSDFSTARSLVRAASILYLFEFILLAGLIVYAISQITALGHIRYKRYVSFMLFSCAIASIFIGVRVIAYVCTAFTMKQSVDYMTSEFSFLLGKWKLYAFVTFMPEVIAVGVWVLVLWSLSMHLKHEKDQGREIFKDDVSVDA